MNGGEFLEPEFNLFHHCLVFSNLIFFVSFLVNLCAFPLSVLLLTFLLCYLSIQLFCYVLLVAIFYSKIVQLLLDPVVNMFSCHLPQLVGRIFLCCFWMSCFVCIVLPIVVFFLNLPSFASTFWFISSSCIVFFPCVAYSFLSEHVPAFFLCFIIFARFRGFLIRVSSRIFHPGFDFLFVVFKEIPIFSQTNFALA